MAPRDLCLDHCHKTGRLRAVLCRNCNGIEGKIYNLANRGKRVHTVSWFLARVWKYWKDYDTIEDPVYHPDHRTDDEKRVKRNKKARVARARKKAVTNVKV